MAESLQFLIKSAFDATGVTAATNSIKAVDSQINRVSRGFTQFMGLIGVGGLGAGLFRFAKSAVNSYQQQEDAIVRLSTAMRNLGVFTNVSLKSHVAFSDQLQATTKYSNDAILQLMGLLSAFGLYGDKLQEATTATLNLSAGLGIDLIASANLVGKAFKGQTQSLSRYGIVIKEGLVGTQKFDEVLKVVNSTMADMATKQAETVSGSLAKLSNQFDDINKRIGGALVPHLKEAIKWWEKFGVVADWALDKLSRKTELDKLQAELENINTALAGQMSAWERLASGVPLVLSKANKEFLKYRKEQIEKNIADIMAASPTPAEIPLRPKTAGINDISNQVKVIDSASLAWVQANQNMVRYYTEHEQKSYKFVSAIEPVAELQERVDADTWKQINKNWKSAVVQNKNTIEKMKQDWEAGARSFSGGFAQALIETQNNLLNWRDNWNSVINSAIGPATLAIHDFFTKTSEGFLRLDTLAKGIFQGILRSFLSMLEQMAAKAAIYGIFSLFTGGAGGGLLKFLGFEAGGPVPGKEGSPVPILAHGGEFVLSANVVKAIKSGSVTSNISGGALSAAGAGANINYSPTININGGVNGGNVREICKQIADAGRKGVVEALDAAKVLYKQGIKREKETAL